MEIRFLGGLLIVAGWGFVPAMLIEYPGDGFRLGGAIAVGIIFSLLGIFVLKVGRLPY